MTSVPVYCSSMGQQCLQSIKAILFNLQVNIQQQLLYHTISDCVIAAQHSFNDTSCIKALIYCLGRIHLLGKKAACQYKNHLITYCSQPPYVPHTLEQQQSLLQWCMAEHLHCTPAIMTHNTSYIMHVYDYWAMGQA